MAILVSSLITAVFWGLFSGSVPLSIPKAYNGFLFMFGRGGDETSFTLIFQIRLPRLLLAILVGASLGTAGACFQGIFRNSLAYPYIIGASSGAALGAAVAISAGAGLGLFSVLGLPGICAFFGSFIAVLMAFVISRASGSSSPGTLILAGTSISAFCSA